MATSSLATGLKVIDMDSHVTEPPDLWTSRMPRKWADITPRVDREPDSGTLFWRMGDRWLMPLTLLSNAGWAEEFPNTAPSLDEVDPACFDARHRLERMDEYGLHAQVLYPNLIGFFLWDFLAGNVDPQFTLDCTRAYNDFLIEEWASVDRNRLIPIAMVPFWDVDGAVREIDHAVETGHKGLLLMNKVTAIGLPSLADPHWDPIYSAAQAADLTFNFHVGAGPHPDVDWFDVRASWADPAAYARDVSLGLMSNSDPIATIVTSGLCERFPDLSFVSVESGFGYVAWLLESLDYHWKVNNAHKMHPDRALPSENFIKHCYGSFWFEEKTLDLLKYYPDNFMYETDFPHSTGIWPRISGSGDIPSNHMARLTAGLPDEIVRKVLRDTAARLYHLDVEAPSQA